jgi:hypothetical protein
VVASIRYRDGLNAKRCGLQYCKVRTIYMVNIKFTRGRDVIIKGGDK